MAQMFDPNAPLPNFQAQQMSIQQQRKLADMLRKQYQEQPEGKMVSGHYVAPSWSQHLAGLAEAGGAAYLDSKADKSQDQYTQGVDQATTGWQSSLPQTIAAQPGRPELPGPQAPDGSPELAAVEPTPAQLPSRDAVLKATLQGMKIPGNEEAAKLWNKGMGEEVIREDTQQHRRDTLKDTLAQQRANKLSELEQRERDALRRSEDFRYGVDQNRDAQRELGEIRKQIAAMKKGSGGDGKGGGDDSEISEAYAKTIAEGKAPMPSPWVMRSEYGKKLMERVLTINPEYDAATFGGRQRAVGVFSGGPEGRSTRSMNVAIEHLDSLDKLVSALHNGDIQIINRIKQEYTKQFGGTAPTNFDSAKHIVGQEIVKAIVANGGSMAERQEAGAQISRANSPQQLKGVIDTYIDLLGGQLRGLEKQYRGTTGLDDYRDKFLTGRSQATFDKLADKEKGSGNKPAPAAPTKGPKPPPGLVLPPGATYVGPAQ